MFNDRRDAGRQLLDALRSLDLPRPVVLALPRGGVPVAAEIAGGLGGPLDLVIVRKIGLPQQPELAMGAVVDAPTPIVLRNDGVIAATGITDEQFHSVELEEIAELARRRERYLAWRRHVPLEGRTAIVVDDGIATGMSMRAALKALRARHPGRLVLAVPVAPPEVLAELSGKVDDTVCLERPEALGAVGAYYRDFGQTTDAEVTALLAASP